MQKVREKSQVIKSKGNSLAFWRGKMWEGNGIRTWGNGLKRPELSFSTQC